MPLNAQTCVLGCKVWSESHPFNTQMKVKDSTSENQTQFTTMLVNIYMPGLVLTTLLAFSYFSCHGGLLILPFYRCGNRGSEGVNHLLKVTTALSRRGRSNPDLGNSRDDTLNHDAVLLRQAASL